MRESLHFLGHAHLKQVVGQRALENARARKQLGKNGAEAFAQAAAYHGAGARAEAQALCERILQYFPQHFDALHMLGVLKFETSQLEEAQALLKRALALQSRSPEAHYHLGLVQFALEQYNAARASYEFAVALKPNFPLALNNLGNTLARLGLFGPAAESYDRAIACQPDYADALCNRGISLLMLARYSEALTSFNGCLALQPANVRALNGQGLALVELRHSDQAIASFERALAIKPDFANAFANRGRAFADLGRYEDAIQSIESALAIDPELENGWMVLGDVFLLTGRTEDAFAAARRAIAIVPDSAPALTLMGQCFATRGDVEEAIAHFDRALAIKPDLEGTITKKLFLLDFSSADFAQSQAARKMWWDQIGSKVAPASPVIHQNDRDPERRVVIGYVSADFRAHSAALCAIAVMRHHNHTAFEVVCYSCSPFRDRVTEEFMQIADRWVDASRLSDDELAARIRADKIDILIDLSGHTAGNRLAVFARKPTPVAVTAWGNPAGTGSPTTDYVFADPVMIPPEVRHLFPERIHDLPCGVTLDPAPAQFRSSEPPCLAKGHVTFGMLNRINKISPDAVRVWSDILRAVPGARLTIKHNALDEAAVRDSIIARFAAQGIPVARLDCIGSTSRDGHLAAYAGVDICLDPFPQNGGISTLEALAMGVPSVCKLGNGLSSRVCGAILTSVGLSEWIGDGEAGYIDVAVKAAASPDVLKALRNELPARIEASVVGNPVAYTKAVEDAYRTFWRRYCVSA